MIDISFHQESQFRTETGVADDGRSQHRIRSGSDGVSLYFDDMPELWRFARQMMDAADAEMASHEAVSVQASAPRDIPF